MSSVFNICGGENNSFTPAPRKIVPQGTLEITENGEYDVSEFADALVAVAGGASNIIAGSFQTNDADANNIQTINIPYDGEGYPLIVAVWIQGGAMSQAAINANRNAVCQTLIVKNIFDTAPTYSGSNNQNKYSVSLMYKSSDAGSAVSGSPSANVGRNIATHDTPSSIQSGQYVVYISDKNTLKALVTPEGSTNSGLATNTEYAYMVIYSE